MTKRILFLLALALLTAGCNAEKDSGEKSEGPKVSETADAVTVIAGEAAYEKLDKEFEDAMAEFRKLYEEAKTREDRQKVVEDHLPKAEDYVDGFMAIHEEHPESKFAAKSLLWVASHVRSGEKGDEALAILLKDHIDLDGMAMQAFMMQRSEPGKKTEDNLNHLMTSSNDKVKGAATYAMAAYMTQVNDMKANLDEYGEYFDEDAIAYIKSSSFGEEEVLAQYKMVAEKFADVTPAEDFPETLGAMAKSSIFEIENLGIGKIAPEIEAEDLAGESFKLSDYRGKVVLLDFWGDW